MPEDPGKVSIITPTYNHAEFIGPCIESVLAQTLPNWEMLIVDDGSTDGTADRVAAYRDPRITYVGLEHKGLDALGERYNLALGRANGQMIAILEGDDFWPSHKLERQVPDFRDEAVVVSSGLFQSTNESGEPQELMPIRLPSTKAILNQEPGAAAAAMFSSGTLTFTFPVSTLIRKAALERIGGFVKPDYLPLVDYPTFLNLSLLGPWRFHLEVLGSWRRHGESVTSNRFFEILDGVHRYAAEFAIANRKTLPVTDTELRSLDDDWRLMQFDRLVLTGMMLLKERDFKLAERYFRRIETFPVTRKWKLTSRFMRSLATARLDPGAMRSMISGKVPCRLDRRDSSRFLSRELDPESIQPHHFIA